MNTAKYRSVVRALAAALPALIGCQIIAGCGLFVAGAVVGAGAYTYINGELKRSYQAGYEKAVQASVTAMKEMNIEVKSIKEQGLTTSIDGNFNGKPVKAGVARVDVNISEVGVRSGWVGVWDKSFSTEVHEKIARRLGS
ncbi:DUF3568 family protein [Desulfococcus sp.]|uniref:DUF3568 family protein n=1 Tax=Desulfococcus sp. TaxID=2025834 RepID=UPI0035933624